MTTGTQWSPQAAAQAASLEPKTGEEQTTVFTTAGNPQEMVLVTAGTQRLEEQAQVGSRAPSAGSGGGLHRSSSLDSGCSSGSLVDPDMILSARQELRRARGAAAYTSGF